MHCRVLLLALLSTALNFDYDLDLARMEAQQLTKDYLEIA